VSETRAETTPAFAELSAALDPKERAFVDEYLECLNATLAARRVWNHKAAKQQGHKALHRADVAAAITAGLAEQNARAHNDPERIIRELMLLAYADPRDLVEARGHVIPLHQLAPEIRRAIASVDFETEKVTTEEVIDEAAPAGPPGIAALAPKKRVTTRTRVIKYRLAAKTQNLELLGKRLKMFSDRLELDAGGNLAALLTASFNRPKPAE
jgi:phage terminase small subunit